MSTQQEILRLEGARNTLRAKGVELGINTYTDKLDVIAAAFDGIENIGAVTAQVQEGGKYTIPRGYHNGGGVITGVAGGGNYDLEPNREVTPSKKEQPITPGEGYYGLYSVTVKPIPDTYQDISSTTATAADVLATKVFVAKDGTTTAGTMKNNGAVTQILNTTTTSYTIPAGYHSGSGKITITTETKTATPTKSAQDITPTTGKVLSKVTVGAIPDKYQDVSGVTVTADRVLDGYYYVSSTGVKTEGTMVNNGGITGSFDGLSTTSYTIPAGYTTGGTVSLTNDIETALAAI